MPDFTDCPNWGKGGKYVVDPETGARVPVVEQETPAPAETDQPVAEEQTDQPKPKKGK